MAEVPLFNQIRQTSQFFWKEITSTYMLIGNPFMAADLLDENIWTFDTFPNNFKIKHTFKKYL